MERLSQALLKAQEDESLLREKTSSLRKSLQEAVASHSSTQSRLATLQKTLTEAEQTKRMLQVSEAFRLNEVIIVIKYYKVTVTITLYQKGPTG